MQDRSYMKNALSVPLEPSVTIDALLASISLFARILPMGPGSSPFWFLESKVQQPSYDALAIKSSIYPVLRKALKNYDPRREPYLLETVLTLNMTDVWIDGWAATDAHRPAVLALEKCATAAFGRQRAFADERLANAFTTAVGKHVSAKDLHRCWTLYVKGITLVRNSGIMVLDMAQGVPEVEDALMSQMSRDHWVSWVRPELEAIAELASSADERVNEAADESSQSSDTPQQQQRIVEVC